MHDLGITASLTLSFSDKESLIDTPQWQALIKAEIQGNKSKLDDMVKKRTLQCEHQAKRKEAREYLRDKKGPEEPVLRQIVHEAVDILWEGQNGHTHAMTISNAGSQHRGERSWWAQGPGCLDRVQEWQQWIKHCLATVGHLNASHSRMGNSASGLKVDSSYSP